MKTPATISTEIIAFLSDINDQSPFFLDVRPAHEAMVGGCFLNVAKAVEEIGGEMISGWQVWQSSFLLEAEYHAIWKTPGNELLDITPKTIREIDKILFLPDPSNPYVGKNVDNIRINISGNKLVDDLILVAELEFAILNRGDRAYKREVSLSLTENQKLLTLRWMKVGILAMISYPATIDFPCFCGSKLPYRNCHSKNING
jgi:hypothetical protein